MKTNNLKLLCASLAVVVPLIVGLGVSIARCGPAVSTDQGARGDKVDNPVKIMPVGDSIAAGEHYKFPALGERTGYRKALYEMLINAGYNVDFVGSQNHGIRPKAARDWYDWNCEAYPGIDCRKGG